MPGESIKWPHPFNLVFDETVFNTQAFHFEIYVSGESVSRDKAESF